MKAGQLLATLNDADAKLRVRDRQTTLQLAERQFQRFNTLAQRSAVSKSEMDVQRANRDAAATALKIAQEELQFLSLRAPFDGVIARVQARNHQVVAAGQPIALLTRADLLDVIFTLPETLFTSLDIQNIDYQPEVQFNALPGRFFTAQYKEHTSQTDAATLTYQVVLTMPRPADLLALPASAARCASGCITCQMPLPSRVWSACGGGVQSRSQPHQSAARLAG